MLRLNGPGDFGLEDASFPPWSLADGSRDFGTPAARFAGTGVLGAGHLAKLEPRQSREIGFYEAVRALSQNFQRHVSTGRSDTYMVTEGAFAVAHSRSLRATRERGRTLAPRTTTRYVEHAELRRARRASLAFARLASPAPPHERLSLARAALRRSLNAHTSACSAARIIEALIGVHLGRWFGPGDYPAPSLSMHALGALSSLAAAWRGRCERRPRKRPTNYGRLRSGQPESTKVQRPERAEDTKTSGLTWTCNLRFQPAIVLGQVVIER